jgi:hypothetical protein
MPYKPLTESVYTVILAEVDQGVMVQMLSCQVSAICMSRWASNQELFLVHWRVDLMVRHTYWQACDYWGGVSILRASSGVSVCW